MVKDIKIITHLILTSIYNNSDNDIIVNVEIDMENNKLTKTVKTVSIVTIVLISL